MRTGIWLAMLGLGAAFGQGTIYNTADGRPPVVLDAGNPGGVYAISDVETVNVYSGQATIAIPLLKVGGRGEAGYTITVPISRPSWTVDVSTVTDQCPLGGETSNCVKYEWRAGAQAQWSNPYYQPGYGPGLFMYKRSATDLVDCGNGLIKYQNTFSYVVYVRPDGSEQGFYSTQAPIGTRYSNCGSEFNALRGAEFMAKDGSGARFIATGYLTNFSDVNTATLTSDGSDATSLITGYMVTKQGTRYDVTEGKVMQIRDRNGNRIKFDYLPPTNVNGRIIRFNLVEKVTDALGRQIRFEYSAGVDRIYYRGATGIQRTIAIRKGFVDEKPRPDYGSTGGAVLFPGLDTATTLTNFQLEAVKEIELPSGQKFDIYFSPYGEPARLVLPSGGAIEWDYGQGLDNPTSFTGVKADGQVLGKLAGQSINVTNGSPPNPPWRPFIYRRLLERRVYANGGSGASFTERTNYLRTETVSSASTSPANNQTSGIVTGFPGYFQVDRAGTDGASPVTSRHYFYTTPRYNYGFTAQSPVTELMLPPYTAGDPDAFVGKEYKTDTAGLRTTETVFGLNPGGTGVAQPCQTNTRLVDGPAGANTITKRFTYDAYENVTNVYEYDFGTALPIDDSGRGNGSLQEVYWKCPVEGASGVNLWTRRTETTYLTAANYLTPAVHLRALPQFSNVYQTGSTQAISSVSYNYDEGTVADAPGIYGALFGTGYGTRGNVTSVTSQVIPAAGAAYPGSDNTTPITTRRTYDIAGNVVTSTDGKSNVTQFAYADDFSTTTSLDSDLSSLKTYAQVTSIQPPGRSADQALKLRYDYYLGKPTRMADANGVVTELAYLRDGNDTIGDPFDRLRVVNHASGDPATKHVTHYDYLDVANGSTVTTRASQYAEDDERALTAVLFDGLGRAVETRTGRTQVVVKKTTYDGFGRVRTVSNPRYSTDSEALTTTDYDVLDRPVKVTLPDGTFAKTEYAGARTSVYETQAVNQGSILSRQLDKDALDRLVKVTEWPTLAQVETTYQYDGLDNLLEVRQGPVGAAQRARSYRYDSLKRLRRADNPETARMYFAYDNNGNVSKKMSTTPTNGNLGEVSFEYDALNRLTKKSYAEAGEARATGTVRQCWDGRVYGLNGCAGDPRAGLLDRLTGVGVSATGTAPGWAESYTEYGYDAQGRVTKSIQSTAKPLVSGQTEPDYLVVTGYYEYYRSGLLGKQTYPSGRGVVTCYDELGRVAWMSVAGTMEDCRGGATPSASYVSGVGYWPHGMVKQMQMGNGLWESTTVDARQRPLAMMLGSAAQSGDQWKLENQYTAAGNVGQQTLTLPKVVSGQATTVGIVTSYGYDRLNRMTAAVERSAGVAAPVCPDAGAYWCQGYLVDEYGNSTVETATNLPVQRLRFDAGNRISGCIDSNNVFVTGCGYQYDDRGNAKAQPAMAAMAYDLESRLVQSGGLTMTYDGEGRRVKKADGSGVTYYGYDAFGQMVAELPVGNQGVKTQYVTVDHLGSTRVVSGTGTPKVEGRYDYLPYGQGVLVSGGSPRSGVVGYEPPASGVPVMYTGQVRDLDTGLDYFGARFYGAAVGRFTSPDAPFADQKVEDPQSWNLYGYAANRPLSYIDPNGQQIVLAGSEEDRKKALGVLKESLGLSADSDFIYEQKKVGKNGTTTYTVGINQRNAEGRSFSQLGALAQSISRIAGDSRSVELSVRQPGETALTRDSGGGIVGDRLERDNPGLSYVGLSGVDRIDMLDPAARPLGVSAPKMSNGVEENSIKSGVILSHELGHLYAKWYTPFMQYLPGFVRAAVSNDTAVLFENRSRLLNHGRGAPLRTRHD